jgi:hypothetical protein
VIDMLGLRVHHSTVTPLRARSLEGFDSGSSGGADVAPETVREPALHGEYFGGAGSYREKPGIEFTFFFCTAPPLGQVAV